MVGPSAGTAASADEAMSSGNSSKPRPIRAIFRKVAHRYRALFLGDWIIEGLGRESVAFGSLWQSLPVEFPSLGTCVRARAKGGRGKVRPRGRQRHRPVRDSW